MKDEKILGGVSPTEGDVASVLSSSTAAPHAAPNYTPGPWTWFTGMFTQGQQDRTGDRMRYIVGADGQGFAHTVGLNPTRDSANADLIAAAPELLEALKEVTKWLEVCTGVDEVTERARAAIAKAEGRS